MRYRTCPQTSDTLSTDLNVSSLEWLNKCQATCCAPLDVWCYAHKFHTSGGNRLRRNELDILMFS